MKEPLLAIAIGFVIGLVITFGIWTANKSLKEANLSTSSSPTPSLSSTISPSISTTPQANTSPIPTTAPTANGITLTSPDDEAVLNTTTTKLQGTVSPNSVVMIFGGPNEQILNANSKGEFSTDLSLESGYNLITINAYDPSGKLSTKTITLTYTTTKI